MFNFETEVRAVFHNFHVHRSHLAVLLTCISWFISFGLWTEIPISNKLPGIVDACHTIDHTWRSKEFRDHSWLCHLIMFWTMVSDYKIQSAFVFALKSLQNFTWNPYKCNVSIYIQFQRGWKVKLTGQYYTASEWPSQMLGFKLSARTVILSYIVITYYFSAWLPSSIKWGYSSRNAVRMHRSICPTTKNLYIAKLQNHNYEYLQFSI